MLGVDWSLFEVATDTGTILPVATLHNAVCDFDQWAFVERTGIQMPRGQRINMVSWTSVLRNLEMDLQSLNRVKLIKELEKDLDVYIDRMRHASRPTAAPAMSEADLKASLAQIHKVFAQRKVNELGLEALAVYVQITYNLDDDLADIKTRLHTAIKLAPNLFSLGGSPAAPVVRRLQDSKGKSTGLEAFPPRKTRGPKRKTGMDLIAAESSTKMLGSGDEEEDEDTE